MATAASATLIRSSSAMQHHDRQRDHEDDRRDRRAEQREHRALLHHTAGVADPLGEQCVVAGAQPAGQPERSDLAGLEPIGEEPLVVGAIAVEFGEAVVEPVERPRVADADDRDRDERHEGDRHEQRRDAQQHQHDDGSGERRRHERDEAPHDLPGVGVGVFAGEPDPVVEAGIFERFQFDGRGHLQQLVHRPLVHELSEQDAQFTQRRVDERGCHERQAEQDEPRREVGGDDVGTVDDQVDELFPDEQFRSRQERHRRW